jgi:hypothetical protein
MSDGTYQDLILHEVPKETIERDMALFLEHELTKIREQRSLPLTWPGKRSIQTLVKMAIPLFIFAATVCRFLGEANGNPRRRLKDILEYETGNVSKLDMTYLPILNQVFAGQGEREKEKLSGEFREIVGAIVVLATPLSIISIASILDTPREDISCRLDSLHSVLNISTDPHIPIRTLHLSFRDFLLDPQKRGSLFWVDERETHERLASKCLRLMSSPKGLKQDVCNLREPGTLRTEIDSRVIDSCLSAEVRYACRYWVYHLEQSQSRIQDGDSVHGFLQKYFLYWLEAMSLAGDAAESIRMINSLQSLTKVSYLSIL